MLTQGESQPVESTGRRRGPHQVEAQTPHNLSGAPETGLGEREEHLLPWHRCAFPIPRFVDYEAQLGI